MFDYKIARVNEVTNGTGWRVSRHRVTNAIYYGSVEIYSRLYRIESPGTPPTFPAHRSRQRFSPGHLGYLALPFEICRFSRN